MKVWAPPDGSHGWGAQRGRRAPLTHHRRARAAAAAFANRSAGCRSAAAATPGPPTARGSCSPPRGRAASRAAWARRWRGRSPGMWYTSHRVSRRLGDRGLMGLWACARARARACRAACPGTATLAPAPLRKRVAAAYAPAAALTAGRSALAPPPCALCLLRPSAARPAAWEAARRPRPHGRGGGRGRGVRHRVRRPGGCAARRGAPLPPPRPPRRRAPGPPRASLPSRAPHSPPSWPPNLTVRPPALSPRAAAAQAWRCGRP